MSADVCSKTSEIVMAETLLVTSCKGGVGKSTVAANLSLALAKDNYRVVAIDCDLTMRSLDLVMGLENESMFNLCDVICGRCTLEKALVKDSRAKNLYFLAAPSGRHVSVDTESFAELIRSVKEYKIDGEPVDYVVIDAPADDECSIALTAPVCDEAIIVCSHMPSAIRAANYTCELLDNYKVEKQRLVINGFDAIGVLERGRAGIIEMIDLSKTKLLGVVPYDSEFALSQEKGELFDSLPKRNNVREAFASIAKRLAGKQVPLFDGFIGKQYKKVLSSDNSDKT